MLKSDSSSAQKEALEMALPVRATRCTSVMKEPSTISLELRSLNVASSVLTLTAKPGEEKKL